MITNNSLWHGVVEDINDPQKLGRVRVRIYGYHDPRISFSDGYIGLSTDNLPWAHVLTQGAAMNGIGTSPSFLVQGTWVTGYFRDAFKQEPIVTGALNGFAQIANTKYPDTFGDPQKVYPLPDHLNEQDVNRLARNDFNDTFSTMLDASSPLTANDDVLHGKQARHQILIDKAVNRTLNVRQVDETSWEEPYQSYSATYPNNLVMETTCGIIREYDSTPGAERIHEYHNTGTFYEIRPDGTRITKVVGSDYSIVAVDRNVLISGNLNVTVIGDSNLVVQGNVTQEIDGNVDQTVNKNVTQLVKQNVNQTVKQNVTQLVEQNVDQTVGGNVTQDITGNVDQTVGGNVTQGISGNVTQTVGGNVNQTISGNLTSSSANISLTAASNVSIQAGGATSIITGGPMVINGAVINIG